MNCQDLDLLILLLKDHLKSFDYLPKHRRKSEGVRVEIERAKRIMGELCELKAIKEKTEQK